MQIYYRDVTKTVNGDRSVFVTSQWQTKKQCVSPGSYLGMLKTYQHLSYLIMYDWNITLSHNITSYDDVTCLLCHPMASHSHKGPLVCHHIARPLTPLQHIYQIHFASNRALVKNPCCLSFKKNSNYDCWFHYVHNAAALEKYRRQVGPIRVLYANNHCNVHRAPNVYDPNK